MTADSALLIVDMQHGEPRRPDGVDVEPVRRDLFREHGGFLLPGTRDAGIVPELAPLEGEPVIVKQRWSAFMMTELLPVLMRLSVKRLVIGGVNTANCVRATAYDAVAYGLDVTVLGDGTGAWDDESQRANLADLARMGVDVRSCDEVAASLPQLQHPSR